MNGKRLAEFRTEIEMGLYVYQAEYGCCYVYRNRFNGMYNLSFGADVIWPTWDEMLADIESGQIFTPRGDSIVLEPLWTILDV